jgi:hypothetical protein
MMRIHIENINGPSAMAAARKNTKLDWRFAVARDWLAMQMVSTGRRNTLS